MLIIMCKIARNGVFVRKTTSQTPFRSSRRFRAHANGCYSRNDGSLSKIVPKTLLTPKYCYFYQDLLNQLIELPNSTKKAKRLKFMCKIDRNVVFKRITTSLTLFHSSHRVQAHANGCYLQTSETIVVFHKFPQKRFFILNNGISNKLNTIR